MLRQRRRVTAELAEKMAKRNPPIPNEDPLVWKERYVAGGNEMTDVLVGSHCITLVFVVGSFVLFMPGRLPAGWVSVYVTPFLLVGTAALFGLGTAASVARERQKNTLVDLFMIPGGRREILRAKLLGAIWFGRWPALTLLTLILLSVAGGTPIAAIPFLLLCSAAFLAFGTFLGLWLSVVCRSTLTANAIWVGVIAFSLVGTFLLAETMSSREIDSTGQLRIVYPRWSQVVNPILGWQELAMTPEVGPKDYAIGTSSWIRVVPLKWPDITDSLVGTALYGGLGWLLWLLSLRRFEKEGREE